MFSLPEKFSAKSIWALYSFSLLVAVTVILFILPLTDGLIQVELGLSKEAKQLTFGVDPLALKTISTPSLALYVEGTVNSFTAWGLPLVLLYIEGPVFHLAQGWAVCIIFIWSSEFNNSLFSGL